MGRATSPCQVLANFLGECWPHEEHSTDSYMHASHGTRHGVRQCIGILQQTRGAFNIVTLSRLHLIAGIPCCTLASTLVLGLGAPGVEWGHNCACSCKSDLMPALSETQHDLHSSPILPCFSDTPHYDRTCACTDRTHMDAEIASQIDYEQQLGTVRYPTTRSYLTGLDFRPLPKGLISGIVGDTSPSARAMLLEVGECWGNMSHFQGGLLNSSESLDHDLTMLPIKHVSGMGRTTCPLPGETVSQARVLFLDSAEMLGSCTTWHGTIHVSGTGGANGSTPRETLFECSQQLPDSSTMHHPNPALLQTYLASGMRRATSPSTGESLPKFCTDNVPRLLETRPPDTTVPRDTSTTGTEQTVCPDATATIASRVHRSTSCHHVRHHTDEAPR